jgi:hypothetical protein
MLMEFEPTRSWLAIVVLLIVAIVAAWRRVT